MAFQTGTKVDPRLMAVDYSPIVRANEIRSQAISNLGGQVGGVIGGAIAQHKKKKQDKVLKEQAANMVLSFVNENQEAGKELGITDIESSKIAIESLGGPEPALRTLSQLQQNQAKSDSLKQNELNKNAAFQALNLAYPAAGEGETSQFNVEAYLQAYSGFGGNDPKVAADVLSLSQKDSKQSALEQKVQLVLKANPDMSLTDAVNVVTGVSKTVTDPITGRVSIVDQSDKSITKVTDSDLPKFPDYEIPEVPKEDSIYEIGSKFTGLTEATKRVAQRGVGQLGIDTATDESIQAAQTISTAASDLVRAFKESDRFSATEDKKLREELNFNIGPTVDAKTFQNKLKSLNKSMDLYHAAAQRTYQDTNLSSKERRAAATRAKAILEFQSKLGIPKEESESPEIPKSQYSDINNMTEEDIDSELEKLKDFLN